MPPLEDLHHPLGRSDGAHPGLGLRVRLDDQASTPDPDHRSRDLDRARGERCQPERRLERWSCSNRGDSLTPSRGKRATVRSREDLARVFAADSRLDVTSEVQKPVHGPVRESSGQHGAMARSGPVHHATATDTEALDLELCHRGRSDRTYRTCADPTNSDQLLQLLGDAIRRSGGQDAAPRDYELVVLGGDCQQDLQEGEGCFS